MDSNKMITISGLRPGEAQHVIALLAHCDLITDDISPEMLKNFLVARNGGAICGVVGLEIFNGDALLRSLAVVEAHRGWGIGLKLVQSAEHYARSRKVATLCLLTLTAKVFFRKAGYDVIERSAAPKALQATGEFKRLCPDSAICMQKDVSYSP